MSTPPPMPSGWFPDPHGRHEHRWFNGTAWTADVADNGQRFIDPLGAAPAPSQRSGDPGQQGNGPATASITCGLIAVAIAWMPFVVVVGIALAIAAVWTGIVGLRRSRTVGRGRGLAITGLVTGVAALLLAIVGVAFSVSVWREVIAFVEPGPHDAEVVACDVEPGAIVVRATITNEDDETNDYTLYAVISEPADVADIMTEVDDVAPGETRDVELRRSAVTDGSCDARIVVHGPLPWGIEMERAND